MSESTNAQEIEISSPLGKVRARGSDIIHVLGLVVLCLVAYVLFQHKIDEKENKEYLVNAIKQSATEQRIAIEQSAEAQLELNYLMTLSTEERKKLNIEMPDSLRKRIRDR